MPAPGWPLALFRITCGLRYLDMALQKAPWIHFSWLKAFIEKNVEMALGLGLLLGLLTRLAVAAGLLWQGNIAWGLRPLAT